eukprot:2186222-Amphidinium_carterae.2
MLEHGSPEKAFIIGVKADIVFFKSVQRHRAGTLSKGTGNFVTMHGHTMMLGLVSKNTSTSTL